MSTKNVEIVDNVYRTKDYTLFKRLGGNRIINDSHVEQIKKSIESNGYIRSPIIVNENMVVIDGQHRLEAVKRLGLPVEFVIAVGADFSECVALNNETTSKWTYADWVNAYAERGNEDFIRIATLAKKYSLLPFTTILYVVNDCRIGDHKAIKNGTFVLSDSDFAHSDEILSTLSKAREHTSKCRGTTMHLLNAIAFAIHVCGVDAQTLLGRLEMYENRMPPVTDTDTALQAVEWLINTNRHEKNRIDLGAARRAYSKKARGEPENPRSDNFKTKYAQTRLQQLGA